MNSPLLNPIWFYLIELFERFGTVFVIIGFFALIIGGGVAIFISMMEIGMYQSALRK